MNWHTLVKRGSRVLAACVLFPIALAVLTSLITIPIPAVVLEFDGGWLGFEGSPVSPTILYFVVLPFLLAVAVVVRSGLTRTPTDLVLAVFATPCLLVTVWAGHSRYFTSPGVYWGGVFSIGAGVFLASAVLLDALLEFREKRI